MIFSNKSRQQQQILPNGSPQAKHTFSLPVRISPATRNRVVETLRYRTGVDHVWFGTAEYRLIGPDGNQVSQDFVVMTVFLPDERQMDLKVKKWAANVARLTGVPEIICIKELDYLQESPTPTGVR